MVVARYVCMLSWQSSRLHRRRRLDIDSGLRCIRAQLLRIRSVMAIPTVSWRAGDADDIASSRNAGDAQRTDVAGTDKMTIE